MSDSVYVVFNPQSGKGRGATLVEPILAALRGCGVDAAHGLTRKAGDETRLTEEALAKGHRRIVAVGGDGTWSNVGNAILRSGVPAKLGLFAGGTGCDLARSLAVPAADLAACARIVRDGASRRIDVGRIEDKYFLNIAGFGFDIAVLEDSWRIRYLRGELLYLYCSVRQIWSFPGFPVEIVADDQDLGRQDLMMLIVANARLFGGGLKIAPRADLADGRLDAVSFRNMGVMRRLDILGKVKKGTHEGEKEVRTLTVRRLQLRFPAPPAYETDGEWNRAQRADLTIETIPGALEVLAPAPAPGS